MGNKSNLFLESETRLNLMRAFAGESQARNRYTMAAGIAHKSGLAVIEGVFRLTAEQEKIHAEQFYNQLSELGGQTIRVDGTYPVDIYNDLLSYLRAAQHNEYQEWEHDYQKFSEIAMREGFPLVGKLFENIANVEQTHGDRFGRYADLLEKGELFCSKVEVQWTCLHCGYVVTSTMAPAQCAVCHHPQGYFMRVELSPYS